MMHHRKYLEMFESCVFSDTPWGFGLVKLEELVDSVSQTCSASRGH